MAVYNATPHHTTPHHTTPHHTTLLPKIRIAFTKIQPVDLNKWLQNWHVTEPALVDRCVLDQDNPDYVIANVAAVNSIEDCSRLRHYLHNNKDSIFIFICGECVDPDLNVFDYAFVVNSHLVCMDRITYIPNWGLTSSGQNDLTRNEARKILQAHPKFCNFMYSHPAETRDAFFHLLSQYKHVDSIGAHLNNTGSKSTRSVDDWYSLSIELKRNYKFSIAMENASYSGYNTEKVVSSFRAHTVPIYWGDPDIAEWINPKAFVNCHDYSSFEEVIERVKEVDNNDELWLDMVTQPWQTDEQRRKTLQASEELGNSMQRILLQDVKAARRRPVGSWPSIAQNGFTSYVGIMPPLHRRILQKIRAFLRQHVSDETKYMLKTLLRMH